MELEIASPITNIETIAQGSGIRILEYLKNRYGKVRLKRKRWLE
jgi:hypothetical protein